MNPFMAFAKEERKKILAEDSSLKSDIAKVGKMMGERWRKLSDAEKARYKAKGASMSSTRKAKKTRKNSEEGVEMRKEKKQKRKGTRKLSGYMKFAKAERASIVNANPKMRSDVTAVARELGKRWRAMSESDKRKYD
jgi:hypothetical protein